ncbi:unnamed protein product, partial [Rotaria magnacalcarata]
TINHRSGIANENIYGSSIDKMRSIVSNNLVIPDASSINHFQESIHCLGPLCKSFICYIDTLPIGHSVLIQLKAYLRLNHFQSVSFSLKKLM